MKLQHKLLALLLPPVIAGLGMRGTESAPAAMPLTGSSGDGTRLFLRVEGVQGASQDRIYREWIEVDRYSLDAEGPTSIPAGGGGTRPPVEFGPLRTSGLMLRAFPGLAARCASGQLISEVQLAVIKPDPSGGGSPYEAGRVTLQDVVVESMQTVGDLTPWMQTDLALNYARIRIELREPRSSGGGGGTSRTWSWDIPNSRSW